MEVITAIAAWAISSTCKSLTAESWLGAICSPRSDPKDLADRLSQNAQVYVPGDPGFDTATNRWSVLDAPTISVVVVPSVEDDVAETVRLLEFAYLRLAALISGFRLNMRMKREYLT